MNKFDKLELFDELIRNVNNESYIGNQKSFKFLIEIFLEEKDYNAIKILLNKLFKISDEYNSKDHMIEDIIKAFVVKSEQPHEKIEEIKKHINEYYFKISKNISFDYPNKPISILLITDIITELKRVKAEQLDVSRNLLIENFLSEKDYGKIKILLNELSNLSNDISVSDCATVKIIKAFEKKIDQPNKKSEKIKDLICNSLKSINKNISRHDYTKGQTAELVASLIIKLLRRDIFVQKYEPPPKYELSKKGFLDPIKKMLLKCKI